MTLTTLAEPATGSRTWLTRRRVVGTIATLAIAGSVMAATGIGTGSGPLGQDTGSSLGLMRAAPATFSTGLYLTNDGWFDVHIESIRPIARDGAAKGMPSREIALTLETYPIGSSEGRGEAEMPRSVRRPPEGFVIPPTDGTPESRAFGVTTWEIVSDGPWFYDGFEVVYRHGLVRHRTVIGPLVSSCPPNDTGSCELD